MQYKAKNAVEAIFAGLDEHGGSRPKLAKALGVNHAHVYLAAPVSGDEGRITPTLREALVEKGWIPPPPKRIRLAADLKDQWSSRDHRRAELRREALIAWAEDQGFDSWSDWARSKADQLIADEQ